MSCGVGCRHDLELALLGLHIATALIRSLAWEPPCAMGVALKKKKKKEKKKKKHRLWSSSSSCGTWLVTMMMQVQPLASFSRLRTQHCHKLQCRSQMELESGLAMAQTSSCSSNGTPRAQKLPYAAGVAIKRKKKKKKSSYVALSQKECLSVPL